MPKARPYGWWGANLDISDRKQAEEQLIYRALHDGLTDLANRTLLTKRLELAIYKAQRSTHYHFAVLFLDLDQFKVINDSLGHLLGDELLQTIARKLQNMVRPTDLAARLGGDEFVILAGACARPAGRYSHGRTAASRVWIAPLPSMAIPFLLPPALALFGAPRPTLRPPTCCETLTLPSIEPKPRGRRRYEIFDVEMHIQAVKRMTLEHDLRIALDQQQFVTYYQPIVDLNTSRFAWGLRR